MSTIPSRYIPQTRPLTVTLLLALVAGFSAPFIALPPAQAAVTPPAGTVELSPTPPNDTQAVSPNIVMTFDDSGSMASAFMGDNRPFDGVGWGGPWMCAGVIDPTGTHGDLSLHAMNGVYYNPGVDYQPPLRADGTSFPPADETLTAVWNDGVTQNRPLNSSDGGTTDFSNHTDRFRNTTFWQCYSDGGYSGNLGNNGNHYKTTQRVAGGGPYYYEYTGPALTTDGYGNPDATSRTNLYTTSNWTAVAVPSEQYQNWANWWAYYRTRNQMARTSISRAFGQLGAAANDGRSFGSSLRAAWQNLYTDDEFRLQNEAIVSELLDANSPACDPGDPSTSDPSIALQSGLKTPPNCYRSAFFNWIFSVTATGNTPSRAATIRAGKFFIRGNGNTGGTGDLNDPYWQPPTAAGADGLELVCRQNFHMLVTDGYSNEGDPALPTAAQNTGVPFKDVINNYALPDGTAYSSSAEESRIIWNNRGGDYPSNMANIAFNYWATDLRPDLYNAAKAAGIANPVPPYMPDPTTGVVTGATSTDLEKYFNPNNDPANWPHLVQYMVTLGVSGDLVHSDDYDCNSGSKNDACSLRTGATTSDGGIGWPRLQNNSPEGIDDVWHATVNSRGKYFNAGNPQDLVNQLSSILSNISARAAQPTTGAVNASVLSEGALSFNTGYSSADWTGVLQAVELRADGSGTVAWDAGAILTATAPGSRQILTDATDGSGTITGMPFQPSSAFDATETAGLQTPALGGGSDTLANRIDYLRGDTSLETDKAGGIYRKRNSLLGAIVNSQPLYVSIPGSGYTNTWPSGSPEIASGAETYDDFVSTHETRPGTVYVGANDGMLHAFAAPVPVCQAHDANGDCTSYDYGAGAGTERWGFVPRAVYSHLGSLSDADFKYAPTVDATPITRDVFFSDQKWHTLLTGGVGMGGRGVYALDITDPTAVTEGTAAGSVLWEFDSDATASPGCVSNIGSCRPSDLGFTFGTPNIGRLANGKWVVLVSNGYFPDCSKGDKPTPCDSSQAPKDSSGNPYSALFVLDAQSGATIAELKTPTSISGVTSFGLATPVLGDYDNNQVDDVAFAGDLQGNLWRFDLSDPDPSKWSVALTYQGIADGSGNQGVQPITVMPRLFPDPTTNRFMVVFGTGKYLGAGDNTSTSAATQSVYGVRDELASDGTTLVTITHDTLVAQTLSESVDTDPSSPTYGITRRLLTNYDVPSGSGGWYFDLKTTASDGTVTDPGERMVVTAGAIFTTNTALIGTLIPGSSDPCNPSAKGAFMAVDATTGGAGSGQSSLGLTPNLYVGGRVDNVRTGGSLPVVSSLGGGSLPIPGLVYSGGTGKTQVQVDAPMWRRRSWQEIEIDQ